MRCAVVLLARAVRLTPLTVGRVSVTPSIAAILLTVFELVLFQISSKSILKDLGFEGPMHPGSFAKSEEAIANRQQPIDNCLWVSDN